MASEEVIESLKSIKGTFDSIEDGKVYRSGLGEASLESILKPKIAETITKLDFTIEYGIHVLEDDVQQAHSHFAHIKEDIDRISELDTSGYVTEGKNHVNKIGGRLEELKKN